MFSTLCGFRTAFSAVVLASELEELEPIAGGARVSVHHGTSRVPARVARVGERTAQLRLSAPVVAARGEEGGRARVEPGRVLREIAPVSVLIQL